MKLMQRRLVAGACGLALAGAATLATMSGASGDTTPGWETDPNAIGTITFYNAGGTVITGGNLSDKPFAAYAVASHAGRAGDDHAQLYAYTPQEGGTNPQTWSGDDLSASAYSPVPGGTPTDVSSSGDPFVVGGAGDLSMNDYIGEYPNALTDAGYQDLYEMRIFTTGTGQSADTSAYDRVDISVDTNAGTWSVVNILPPAPTLIGHVAITGTARVGSTVTCTASFTGAASVGYAWKANGAAISGATKPTLAIPAAEYNKSLTCTATGRNTGGSTPGTSVAKKVAKGPALKITKKPKVTGKAVKGKTLKVSHGTWSPTATKYLYQWTANGRAIKHATKASFKLPRAEVGKKVGCTVTAEKTGYANGVAKTSALKVKK